MTINQKIRRAAEKGNIGALTRLKLIKNEREEEMKREHKKYQEREAAAKHATAAPPEREMTVDQGEKAGFAPCEIRYGHWPDGSRLVYN